MALVLGLGLLLPPGFLALRFLAAPSSKVQIQDRIVVVTGGSSGIGLELAKMLAAQGARKIILLARNAHRLRDAQAQILATVDGVEVSCCSVDVVDRAGLKRVFSEIGAVDLLVCSHGISLPCKFEDASLEDFDTMVDINFKGTINTIKAALPGMLQGKGEYARSIAIFSSQAAQAGIFGHAVYSGTKSALVQFAQALKQELFLRNIQVSVIYPPDTETPGFREENKTKPEITAILSASSSAMEATDVARVALKGIKAGTFNVACNLEGHMLGVASAGMSPQTSVSYSLWEIFFSPIARIISLCVQHGWYRTIRRCSSKQNY